MPARSLAILLSLLFAAGAVPASSPAEPEAGLTADQLKRKASLVVVGAVTEIWTMKVGRETRVRAEIRVHKVEQSPKDKKEAQAEKEREKKEKEDAKKQPKLADEKLKMREPEDPRLDAPKPPEPRLSEQDKLKTGDIITVTWWAREPRPGQKSPTGHRADFARPGRLVRVHTDEEYQVLAPNGVAEAEPIFATPEMLKNRELSHVRDAAAKATAIGAHDEAAKLWQFTVELQDEGAPEHRFAWAQSLAASRRFVEASQVLMPVALRKKDESSAFKRKDEARRFVLTCLWACGDDKAYLKGVTEIAKSDESADRWKEVAEAARALGDDGAAKAADAKVKALGGDEKKDEKPKKK